MSLTENLKLRCPISDCRVIKVKSGTAMGGAITAGTVKVISGVLGIALDDIAVDVSNNSVAESIWIVYAPKIQVTKVADTSRTWTAGKKLYHNGTAFTDLSTNLACCGYALSEQLATDVTGLMCFMGDNIAITADINATA